MQDPLDFSPADDQNEVYTTWYNGYYCTNCHRYEVSACTPDLPTPRVADHIERCGMSHFWWTQSPHPKITQAFQSLTEIGKMALLIKLFKKVDETEMDFEVSQEAINAMTNKLGSTMQVLQSHQQRYKK